KGCLFLVPSGLQSARGHCRGQLRHPSAPNSGTKQHRTCRDVLITPPLLVTICSCCSKRFPTGTASRPPSASCAIRLDGTCGAPAATRILSNGACSASPTLPSPQTTCALE